MQVLQSAVVSVLQALAYRCCVVSRPLDQRSTQLGCLCTIAFMTVPAAGQGLAFRYCHHQLLHPAVLSASLLPTAARLMLLDLVHTQLPSAKLCDHDHPCRDNQVFLESHSTNFAYQMQTKGYLFNISKARNFLHLGPRALKCYRSYGTAPCCNKSRTAADEKSCCSGIAPLLTAMCKAGDPSHSLNISAPASSSASIHSKLPTPPNQGVHTAAARQVNKTRRHTSENGHMERCAPVSIPCIQFELVVRQALQDKQYFVIDPGASLNLARLGGSLDTLTATNAESALTCSRACNCVASSLSQASWKGLRTNK